MLAQSIVVHRTNFSVFIATAKHMPYVQNASSCTIQKLQIASVQELVGMPMANLTCL
jgi:hypothetical protein